MEKTSLGWSHYAEKYGERGFKARYKEMKTFPVLAPQYYGLTLTLTFFPILSALGFNSSSLSPLCSPYWLNYQMTKMTLVMTELICSQEASP